MICGTCEDEHRWEVARPWCTCTALLLSASSPLQPSCRRLSGFRLFHNHLTIDALRDVLGFGSDAFNAVLKRLRLDVFQTAAEHGIDVIFTNNSVWNVPDGREQFASFATDARKRV